MATRIPVFQCFVQDCITGGVAVHQQDGILHTTSVSLPQTAMIRLGLYTFLAEEERKFVAQGTCLTVHNPGGCASPPPMQGLDVLVHIDHVGGRARIGLAADL